MTREPERNAKSCDQQGSLAMLAVVSLIVGVASGLLGAIFRLTLEQADRLRDSVLRWGHGEGSTGLLCTVGVAAAATALAAWLVRRYAPYASGSGIPHVEAVVKEELPPAPFRLIPVKFFGGLLAIGSGLALGREGPSVQMGVSLAHLLGVAFRRNWPDCKVLLAAMDRLHRWPVELRAALIGATVGLLAWFAPSLVGGGDPITQRMLTGTDALAIVAGVFILRFGLGALSYAAGTPGGLFAPMLVLGSQSGLLFGTLCSRWAPSVAPHPMAFAVVGMAAFFTAVVRAPVTGIVLVTELTASVTLLLPMLAACFAAMVVPTLLGNAPIYDALRPRTLHVTTTQGD